MSYWERKSFFYPRDLIVCGAGFTGLSAAIYYKRRFPEKSVLILEKDPINGGASTKNAGFACFGSISELIDNLKHEDENEVFGLVEKRWRGLQNLRSLLGDDAIGFQKNHGFELFLENEDLLFDECREKLDYFNYHLQRICGKNVYRIDDEKIAQFGFQGVKHLIENTEEGQVDTGKMYRSLYALAVETGVEIMHGISIESFEENPTEICIQTSRGEIFAGQFLIANNGFAKKLLPRLEVVPARAQVLVTTPIKDLKIKGCFHYDEGYYYFRNIDDRILFGGARNLDFETETTVDLQLNEMLQARLEEMLRDVILPGQTFQIDQRWSGIMGMGSKKQVIVKKLSDKTFCAVRLSGMGLALSTLIGKEVVDMMS